MGRNSVVFPSFFAVGFTTTRETLPATGKIKASLILTAMYFLVFCIWKLARSRTQIEITLERLIEKILIIYFQIYY